MIRAISAAILSAAAGTALAGVGDVATHRHLPGTTHGGCGKAAFAARMIESGLSPTGESTFPVGLRAAAQLSDTDLTHVDMDIEVFFIGQSLGGTVAHHLTSSVDNLTTYTFQLDDNMTVSAVTVDGVAASLTNNGDSRLVTLPVAKNTGESFVVEITYSGATSSRRIQGNLPGSIEWMNIADDTAPTTNPPVPIVYTLSQPYFAYTWWPCKDTFDGGVGDYGDKFTIDFSITAPSNFQSTANGVLTGIDALSGGRARYNYSHNYEIPTYLVAFATSQYEMQQRTWDYSDGVNNYSMPLDAWFTTANAQPNAFEEWFKMGDMLTVFSDLWGVYPFHEERYGMYEFGFPGGMEHQTNTGQIGWFFADWLTAHEAAHQWFGDWVTCSGWNDIWFQEGMASYAEVLWEEFKPDAFDPEQARIDLMTGDYYPTSQNSSAYVYDTSDSERMFNYNYTYLRGGWVWHMIRGQAGDAAFFQALQDFAAWYAQDAATTDEVLAAVNASTGMDFTDLFADYVYGSGAPSYEYGWQNITVNGQNYLRLGLAQSQSELDGDGGLFDNPVPFRRNGTDLFEIQPEARQQYYTIPTDSATSFLELDPQEWILKRFALEGILLDAPPVVVEAAADENGASIGFIQRVNIESGDVSVVTADSAGTPQAFDFSYSNIQNVATLTFPGGLPDGDYLITVADSVTSTDEGVALDGDGDTLPSGDGVAGGAFELFFTVGSPCLADTNGDGFLDVGDITAYVALFLANDPAAETNGDGILDLGDIRTFVDLFLAGCD